jgi:hypothetical protein
MMYPPPVQGFVKCVVECCLLRNNIELSDSIHEIIIVCVCVCVSVSVWWAWGHTVVMFLYLFFYLYR